MKIKQKATIGDAVLELVCREYFVKHRLDLHLKRLIVSNKNLYRVAKGLDIAKDGLADKTGGTVMEAFIYEMYDSKGLNHVREFIIKIIIEDGTQ